MIIGIAGRLKFERALTGMLLRVYADPQIGILHHCPEQIGKLPEPANGAHFYGNTNAIVRGKGHWGFNERYEWVQDLQRT